MSSNYVIILIIAINIITFLIYGLDKFLAIHHLYRISENILITFSIFGSVGAILAMVVFNHKHHKLKFRVLIPIFVIVFIICIIKNTLL